jgi:hypothetical protein
MYTPVVLDPKDILEADATVIAGFLVLLTILFILAPSVESAPTMRWVKSKISVPAIIIVGLFSISASLVVLGDILGAKYLVLFDFGKYLTVAAFGALIVGLGVVLQLLRKANFI